MRFTSLICLLAVQSAGCAFKEKPPEGAGQVLSGSPEPILSVTVSWKEGGADSPQAERSDKRRLRRAPEPLFWIWDAPLQLPPGVPTSLELRFDVPAGAERLRGLTVEDVVIEGRRGRGDAGGGYDERFRPLRRGAGLEVNPSITQSDVTTAKVMIEDLRSLFPEQEQGVLEIRISLRDASGNWISRYSGELRTPPSLVAFQARATEALEVGGRLLDRELKRVLVGNTQLDLLRVLEVKNGSSRPIEVDYPNRLREARLSTRLEVFEYVDQGCTSEVRHTDTQPSYTEAVYLASFKGLGEETAFIGSNPQAGTVRTLRLEVGETAWLGVYGSGSELPAFVDNGRAQSSLSPAKVAGRCYWQCQGKSDYVWWFKEENYGNPHYVECRACEGGNIDSCNSCHANEPRSVTKPSTYCFGWAQTREQLDVELGTRTYPIDLQIPAQFNRLQLRWPEAAEVREVEWPAPSIRYLD